MFYDSVTSVNLFSKLNVTVFDKVYFSKSKLISTIVGRVKGLVWFCDAHV